METNVRDKNSWSKIADTVYTMVGEAVNQDWN